MEKNLAWFKKTIAPYLQDYQIEYKFFKKGDFGSLDQVEFNSELKGGGIDFWSSGWVGIHLVDYEEGIELLNLLMEPTEKERINASPEQLKDLLKEESG